MGTDRIECTKIYTSIDDVYNALSFMPNVGNAIDEGIDVNRMVKCVFRFAFDGQEYYNRVLQHLIDVDLDEVTRKDLEIAELCVLADELGYRNNYLVGEKSFLRFCYDDARCINELEVCLYHA